MAQIVWNCQTSFWKAKAKNKKYLSFEIHMFTKSLLKLLR